MTTADLAYYQHACDDTKVAAIIAQTNRDNAIRHAITEHFTHQQIADATGLTRGRIGQIAKTHA